ncbi:MAG: response regulator [Leptolyngbyaceae cyanobacterium bins.349]|nr:response regulator [Leptolyngbyaceae cyanobacterium bins.349]
MNGQAAERLILVIEDNPQHLSRIEAALRESTVPHRLIAIASGTAALQYLYRRDEFVDAVRPDLILLDFNLPDKDGREILEEIKSNAQLRRIPIVILTMSAEAEDIFNSYSLQGNCYVIKSENLDQLFQVVKRIEEFWLGIVTLPLE